MRKYLEVSRIYMKSQLVWRADVLFNMIFTIMKIVFAYLLWSIILKEKSMVSEFTFHGMLSYYIVSSFLSQLEMSKGISEEIYQRIRNGTFSKYMIVPVNIEMYFMAMELGVVAFYFLFDLLAALVWIAVFQIQFTIVTNAWILLSAFFMILIGMIFMIQLNFFPRLVNVKISGNQFLSDDQKQSD